MQPKGTCFHNRLIVFIQLQLFFHLSMISRELIKISQPSNTLCSPEILLSCLFFLSRHSPRNEKIIIHKFKTNSNTVLLFMNDKYLENFATLNVCSAFHKQNVNLAPPTTPPIQHRKRCQSTPQVSGPINPKISLTKNYKFL